MTPFIIESIGYFASASLIISFMLKEMRPMRMLNMFAAILFVLYGVLINKPPIMITNLIIVGVQIYHLFIYKSPQAAEQSSP